MPVDEGQNWEFKGHRNFSADEIPAWRPDGTKVYAFRNPKEFAKLTNGVHRTRQPISRYISALYIIILNFVQILLQYECFKGFKHVKKMFA